MKKLMIAIAAVAMGFAANASSYWWGIQSFDYTGPDGSGYDADMGANLWSGGTAFLYLGTVSYDNGFKTGDATQIAYAGFDDASFGYGVLDNSDVSLLPTSDAINAAGGQAYSIVLVDTMATSLDDKNIKNYIILTGTSTAEYDPVAELSYAGMIDTSVIGGQGTAWTPVPEPTSGLLMLLGMAGLALRRRHA
jgi:hypothetical protein